MKVRVYIKLKQSVLDPQGKAVENGLKNLGFTGINDVRVGKLIQLSVDDRPPEDIHNDITDMCEKLLANTVIEDYSFEIEK